MRVRQSTDTADRLSRDDSDPLSSTIERSVACEC